MTPAGNINRRKARRLLDDNDARLTAARSEAEMFSNAREDLQRINGEVFGKVLLNGIPLTLDELLSLTADELKQVGLRREQLLAAADQAERVSEYKRRAAAAQAKVAESGPLIEGIRRYLAQQGVTL